MLYFLHVHVWHVRLVYFVSVISVHLCRVMLFITDVHYRFLCMADPCSWWLWYPVSFETRDDKQPKMLPSSRLVCTPSAPISTQPSVSHDTGNQTHSYCQALCLLACDLSPTHREPLESSLTQQTVNLIDLYCQGGFYWDSHHKGRLSEDMSQRNFRTDMFITRYGRWKEKEKDSSKQIFLLQFLLKMGLLDFSLCYCTINVQCKVTKCMLVLIYARCQW